MLDRNAIADTADLTPVSVFVNQATGEAFTTTRQGYLAKWRDTPGRPIPTQIGRDQAIFSGMPPDSQIAVAPDGEMFSLIKRDESKIIFYRWSHMTVLSEIEYSGEDVMSVAMSPDGKWLAVGFIESQFLDSIILVHRKDLEIVGKVWGGESTDVLVFDDTSKYLAAICFTGCDNYVRAYRIEQTGALTRVCEKMPHDWPRYDGPFSSDVTSVAISAESNLIATFITWKTHGQAEPMTCKGTCVANCLQTGKRLWLKSFASLVASDISFVHDWVASSYLAGKVAFLNPNELICNGSYDSMIVLDALTGEETRRIPLGHQSGVQSFALDRQRKRLWTVSAQSEVHIYDV